MKEQKAGAYAQKRYDEALRRYRRRMRPHYIGFLVAGVLCYVVVIVFHGLDWWSFTSGLFAGAFFSLSLWVRDEPPEFIAKWGRGAEGERRTAKAIAPLLSEGWKVRHDVDVGRGNADHVLLDPQGVGYVLETKTLAGVRCPSREAC